MARETSPGLLILLLPPLTPRISSPHYPCSTWSTLCVLRCCSRKASSQAPCLWPLTGSDKAEAQQICGWGEKEVGVSSLPAHCSSTSHSPILTAHTTSYLPAPPAFEAVTASCYCDLDTLMPLVCSPDAAHLSAHCPLKSFNLNQESVNFGPQANSNPLAFCKDSFTGPRSHPPPIL